VHNKLEMLLGREHAFLDRVYFCPHHPEKGFPGERAELKIDCDCRKPKIGMVVRATKDLNLDLSCCWLIGDSTTDVQTARNAGLKSILVRTGHSGNDRRYPVEPDETFDTLAQAARFLMAREEAATL
jgi:mannose-1-phosphate guanylyltransferase/phosphomannomutase